MTFSDKKIVLIKKWGVPLYFSLAMSYFMLSFFLPLSSKAINNGFYVGVGLPALVYCVFHGLYKQLFSPKYILFILAVVSPFLISSIQLYFDFVGSEYRKFDFD
ncbi:MAG: hypothetical protein KUG73_12215, partial [Pseudomonadales bacterium]|nr:hypothetical protein [Pseudomonadales bacterium]